MKNIFNWNHVSEKLTEDQISELKSNCTNSIIKNIGFSKCIISNSFKKSRTMACNIVSALLVVTGTVSWWCNAKPRGSSRNQYLVLGSCLKHIQRLKITKGRLKCLNSHTLRTKRF